MRETPIQKPRIAPRLSAANMQKVRSLLREAEKALMRKNHDEAERILIQALTIRPDFLDAKAKLAKLYLMLDRDPKAEAMYRELLLKSNDVSLHANLGLACYKQGKFSESCAAYAAALELDPRSPERIAVLGRACMAARRLTEAVDLFERACERLARDTELLHLLGECYERLGHHKEAEDTYRRIHRILPYDETVKEKLAAFASV